MKKRFKRGVILLAAGITLAAMPAMAAKNLVARNCNGCHQSDGKTIWGTIVPGSQTDTSLKVTTGEDVWDVNYDGRSSLDTMATVKDLRDEKAVEIVFRSETDGGVYAEEIRYKSPWDFKNPADVLTISEVVELLKKSPKAGNYMIVDARGYDNYIDGHLPNAVLIPYYRLQAFKDRLPTDKNTLIVAYCRGFS